MLKGFINTHDTMWIHETNYEGIWPFLVPLDDLGSILMSENLEHNETMEWTLPREQENRVTGLVLNSSDGPWD